MRLNCVITDDEPIARETIEDYIALVPGLNMIAECSTATETFEVLRQKEVDVLFIDIHMPGISGLDFIRSLKSQPAIVFTTAYPNYVIDGFDVDAVDYLLKPVSIDRFLRAVDKVYQRTEQEPEMKQATDKKFFFTRSNSDLLKVEYDSILFVEGLDNYVRIHCEHKTIISSNAMKHMEDLLAGHRFLRIHHSYLVNLNKVSSVHDNIFKLGNTDLAVGKSYRETVAAMLKSLYSI
jgi:DNA-binding LytR/AlgR family response regulator